MVGSVQEIANLVFHYAELIDLGDFESVGRLFAHGHVTTNLDPTERKGAAGMQTQLEEWTRRYADGTPRTKHLTTNLIIEVDEEAVTARCRSYYCVLQQTDSLPLQPIAACRYHDEFRRIDGTWRFAHRHYLNDLVGDVSAHLLQSIP